MRLSTYRSDGTLRPGIIVQNNLYDLNEALAPASPVGELSDLIASPHLLQALQERLKEKVSWPQPIPSPSLTAPIPRPSKNIFCVGRNYADHAKERGAEVSAHPVFFTKAPNTVIGPGDPILHHPITEQLDYEAELAVVIGREGRNITRDEAMDHVFGYTIINDVTARDIQKRHQQWFKGKSLDNSCPMGPYLVTKDEIDPQALTVQLWVNGELRQSAPTCDMVFDIPTLIEVLSTGYTLEPGDIIATGTPSGVGAGFQPPRFLQVGDEVEVEITGLGRLHNRVARPN